MAGLAEGYEVLSVVGAALAAGLDVVDVHVQVVVAVAAAVFVAAEDVLAGFWGDVFGVLGCCALGLVLLGGGLGLMGCGFW